MTRDDSVAKVIADLRDGALLVALRSPATCVFMRRLADRLAFIEQALMQAEKDNDVDIPNGAIGLDR